MSRVLYLVVMVFVCACSSSERKLYMDSGQNIKMDKCGTRSFVNLFAVYRCASLELEENNNFIDRDTPIHEKKAALLKNGQRLLILEEKLFGAALRKDDLEPVCNRRLKIVLNPGSGEGQQFQVGWITYQPECLKFYKK